MCIGASVGRSACNMPECLRTCPESVLMCPYYVIIHMCIGASGGKYACMYARIYVCA